MTKRLIVAHGKLTVEERKAVLKRIESLDGTAEWLIGETLYMLEKMHDNRGGYALSACRQTRLLGFPKTVSDRELYTCRND